MRKILDSRTRGRQFSQSWVYLWQGGRNWFYSKAWTNFCPERKDEHWHSLWDRFVSQQGLQASRPFTSTCSLQQTYGKYQAIMQIGLPLSLPFPLPSLFSLQGHGKLFFSFPFPLRATSEVSVSWQRRICEKAGPSLFLSPSPSLSLSPFLSFSSRNCLRSFFSSPPFSLSLSLFPLSHSAWIMTASGREMLGVSGKEGGEGGSEARGRKDTASSHKRMNAYFTVKPFCPPPTPQVCTRPKSQWRSFFHKMSSRHNNSS